MLELTPKEKAKELYNEFYGIPLYLKTVNQCCNIVANEVLKYSKAHGFIALTEYWEEVKLEIKNL